MSRLRTVVAEIAKACMRKPTTSILFLLGLLTGCAYGNVIFAGKSLVYSDNYNPMDYRALPENYGPGFVPPERWQACGFVSLPNIRDPSATFWQWEPATEFFRQAIADGEPPFWDPYVGGGAPLMANLTQSLFFPPSVSVVLLGNGSRLRNALHLGLVFAAGLFTWWFLRLHDLSWPAAATGAVAFMLGGGVVQTAGSFIGQAVVCIPFVMWLTSRFLASPTVTRGLVMALGYASAALASFPPALVQAFGFAAVYALVMTLSRGAARPSVPSCGVVLARYTVFVLIGMALVMFYYLPVIELAGDTPHVTRFYEREGQRTLALRNLAQLWWPVLAGGAQVYDTKTIPMPIGYLSYAGASALCLALFSDRRGQGNRGPLWIVCVALSMVIVLKLLGVPPVHWVAWLPVFNSIHYVFYFGFGLGFLAAVLAAIGCENIRQHRVSARRVILVVAMVAGLLAWLLQEGLGEGLVRWVPPSRWLFEWWRSAICGALAIALAVASYRRRHQTRPSTGLALALLAIVAGEGVRNAAFPRQVRNEVFKRPPAYIRALQEQGPLVRVLTLGNAPNGNTNSPFAVSQLDSLFTFNSPRMFELYKRYAAPKAYLFLREATQIPPEPVLDAAGIGLMSVRVAASTLLEEVRLRQYRQIFDDEYVQIFARNSPSRCFFTSDFRVLPSSEVLEAVALPRPPRQILLESAPVNLSPSANQPDDPLPARIALHRNALDVTLRAPRNGLVYCSDALMPGWHATVNGDAAPLMFANHGFRALPVPAGDLEIRMAYRPPGFAAGSIISGAALVVVALLAVGGRRRN